MIAVGICLVIAGYTLGSFWLSLAGFYLILEDETIRKWLQDRNLKKISHSGESKARSNEHDAA